MSDETVNAPAKTLREILAEDQELRSRLLDILLPQPPRKVSLSYEEFLDRIDEDTSAEWVDGEIIMTSPASAQHQRITVFLASILLAYTESHALGVVFSDRFQMKLTRSGREPDLLFVATEHLDRLKPTYLDGPADLAVEIMSPESIGRDRGDKFKEYEEAGVPEYWLIDPERQQADFYQQDARGYYHPILPDAEGIYHSSVVKGFGLRIAWLWQPPHVVETLRELGLV
jgi:Uma2 family endonuclease